MTEVDYEQMQMGMDYEHEETRESGDAMDKVIVMACVLILVALPLILTDSVLA